MGKERVNEMKRIKRSLAVLMAVLLMLPTQGIMAAEELPLNTAAEQSIEEGGVEKDFSDTEEAFGTEEDSEEEEERTDDEEGSVEDDSKDETDSPEEVELAKERASEDGEETVAGDAFESVIGEKEISKEENATEEKISQEDVDGEKVAGEAATGEEKISAEESDKQVFAADEDEAEEENLEEDLVYDIDLEDGQGKDFGLDKKQKKATPSNAKEMSEEEVGFNTGSKVYYVVSQEDFDNGFGDVSFEDDGSYTINIPEENPFFPYEVQFTWEGRTKNVWFMTPEDSVEIGGHTFYVSAFFDGTVVTQMSFEVAGDTVVVYPEEKEFTDGDGIMPTSLLPLEKRSLSVDFTGYTPIELTMVAFRDIFTGENALKDTDNIMWTYKTSEKDYEISASDGILDLSCGTYYGGYNSLEMIVGAADQLAADNIRYWINVEATPSKEWLIPTLYQQDSEGTRTEVEIIDNDGYYDGNINSTNRYLRFTVARKEMNDQAENYVGLELNPSVFETVLYDHVTVYSGNYKDAATAEAEGTDITAQIFTKDMTAAGAGYLMANSSPWITMVAYDSAGTVLGCLPLRIQMNQSGDYVTNYGLYRKSDSGRETAYYNINYSYEDNSHVEIVTYTLRAGLAVDDEYAMLFAARRADGSKDSSVVTAAYVGLYESIEEATQKGATDIKESLFDDSDNGGYTANYSQGVYFTIFIGADNEEQQNIYQYCIKTKEYEERVPDPNSGTAVTFTGLVDEQGFVVSYKIEQNKDSYAEQNFITMLVDLDVDLTKLAPEFYTETGIHLYAAGSSSPEISGESFHDFSQGPVQYTASAENGKNAKNYWLHVLKAKEGVGQLYINSLSDENAKTREDNGVVYSTREMFLDGRYNYYHDILVTNVGTEPVTKLSAELVSNQVELDPYWTFKGDYDLAGVGAIQSYGEMQNLAKLRILPKEGVEGGTDISGILRIKSGGQTLIELTLTGVVGDPCIITKEIPVAVKYVPYGTMIQNSNKYSWNEVSYSLNGGKLPGGMILKPNGELYGVPTETGEFTFTVRMTNSFGRFSSSQRKFTLTVIENTNMNVENATDQGYELIERVPNISMNSTEDHRMVSVGVYDEFVALFLDGERLVEGVDYDSESGSTRITIRNQTLKRPQTAGTHTLGIEFRTKGTDVLKRAAQNYVLTKKSSGGGGGGGSSSGSSSSSSSSNKSTTSGTVSQDAKKGYVNSQTGIVTGTGAGYANWQQDERGWKMIYADGTTAGGSMLTLENGAVVEQVLWEKINGAWYAFGADGYLKTGWIYDYQLSSWYYVSVDKGMQSGWHTDDADKRTYYYLDPTTGAMVSGWKNINNIWYYFNDTATGEKPFGAMYANEATPDGYHVNADGAWDGQSN